MLKNLKLGAKIVGGFVIVLVLLAVVAYVGYNGLTGVVDRVEKADDVNRLIKDTLHSRQQEKNFIIRGDKEYADKVQEYVAHLKKQAKETKDKFKDSANKQQMDEVVTAVGKYEKGFGDYVDLQVKVGAADARMVEAARGLQAMADTIRAEQKKELEQVKADGDAQIKDKMTKGDDANRIIKWALESRRQEKNYIIRQEGKYVKEVDSRVKEIITLAKDMKSRFNQAKNKEQADNITASAQAYKAAFDEYVVTSAKEDEDKMLQEARGLIAMADTVRAEQKKELAGVQAEANAQIEDKMLKADDANRIIKWALACRQQEKNFMMRGDKKYVEVVEKSIADIITLSKDMKSRFNQVHNKEQADHIITSAQAYKAAFDEVVVIKGKQEEASSAMVAAARATQEVCDTARADQKKKMEGQISTANSIMLVGSAVAIILGSLLAFFITRGITKPINRIIEGLSEGAEQVASASGQVSSSSQSLAEGASEQASSLEETSSSLEEMASMTKQNADSGNQANTLMEQANQVISKANSSMGELTTSMEDISKASEETSKIIKTIDEIAFQTNLLALNAAVEAARAGEAGAGFAVVADEVRNLALRAADAAKNTADLIEGTVKKVKDGGDLVSSTNEAFTEVATSSSKVGELVGEIAAASNEQAQGIENVNTAIAEMDKVTQSNAANAEESASASEEMNAQAEQMKGVVGELIALVGGSAASRAEHTQYAQRGEVKTVGRKAAPAVHKAIAAPVRKARKKQAAAQEKEVKPDQVIPMEEGEGDFKDF